MFKTMDRRVIEIFEDLCQAILELPEVDIEFEWNTS